MRKIDILRIIHRYLSDSTVDKISGGLEIKNLGIILSILKGYSYHRGEFFKDSQRFISFNFSTTYLLRSNRLFYNPELDYCFIGDTKIQISDLEDKNQPDEMLILSYGRSILDEMEVP